MLNRELDSVISRIQIVFSFVCREKVEQLGYITLTDKPWSLRHSFRADVIMPGGRWPETENKRICQTVSSCRFLLGLPIFRGRGRLRNLSGVRSRKRKWKKNEKNAWSKVTVSSNWQPRQHVPVKWIPPLEGDGNYFFDTVIVLWLTMTTPEIQTSMNLVRKVQRNNFNYKTNEQNCSSIRHIRIWSEL